ncbi:MAG: response regulator [Desulfobacteraceae bacterium]|jgi:PAS domain S-box-containing protein
MMPTATIKALSEVVYKYNLISGKYQYIIPISDEIGGSSFADWMDKACRDLLYLVHPDDRKSVKAHFERIRSAGSDDSMESSIEYRLKTNDGSYHWFSDKHALLLGREGRPDAVIGNIRDLTKERLAENTAQEFAHILSRSTDYLALIDRNYTYRAVSKAYAHTLKRDRDDIIGKTVADIFGPELFQKTIKPMADRCLDGQIARFQTWIPLTGSDRKLLDIEYVPHFEKGQKVKTVSGYVESTRDITDIKKLEGQLLQICRMQTIGMLAGGIAHDFNNILSAIIGYAELSLAQTPKASELYGYQQQILQAGQRATDLVHQILTFSRNNHKVLQPVKIKDVFNEVLDFIRASLPATIEIERKLESESYVMADATQIYQILMNLCANAGFAMRKKGGFLRISLSEIELGAATAAPLAEMRPGRYIKLKVSDTGSGMTAEIKERIFDPFFTTKDKGKGTGIGLSLSYDIIKSYGGGMTVESAPGQGTVFDVYFPVVKDATPTEVDMDPRVLRGKERILFVDDEDTLADLGKQMIEFLGYRVTARVNSLEALTLFQKDPHAFDLVITDLVMPGMSGDELARNILAIRPDIPVILITGFAEQVTTEKAASIGVKKLVTKPIVMKDIAKLIRDALA